MDKALVSIIIPCYNSDQYIARLLDSILIQTYDDIQLIMINDGSIDKTEDIILSYKLQIEQRGYSLSYHKQENKGLGGAINTGLKMINGVYFTWCDSDNYYSGDYVEKTVDIFQSNNNCSIVRCDVYAVLENLVGNPVRLLTDSNDNGNLFRNMLICKDFHFGCTMLLTESFIEVNPTRTIYESRHGQNWQIMLPMLYQFRSFYISEPLFYFVIRPDSLSHSISKEGLAENVAKNNEYEKILLVTINSMNMSDSDLKKYTEIIKEHYIRLRLKIAKRFNNKILYKQQYKLLKRKEFGDRLNYYSVFPPLCYSCAKKLIIYFGNVYKC